jgi:hypothetical protein
VLVEGGEVAAVIAPPGFLGGTKDELALLFAPISASPDDQCTEEGRDEPDYLCPKKTGKPLAFLRGAESVSITTHAEANITAIARITSTVGLVMNFQIFCQGVLPLLRDRIIETPRERALTTAGFPEGFLAKV